LRVDIDADDLAGPRHAQALDDVEADPAETENDGAAADLDLAVLMTAPMPVVTPQPI